MPGPVHRSTIVEAGIMNVFEGRGGGPQHTLIQVLLGDKFLLRYKVYTTGGVTRIVSPAPTVIGLHYDDLLRRTIGCNDGR